MRGLSTLSENVLSRQIQSILSDPFQIGKIIFPFLTTATLIFGAISFWHGSHVSPPQATNLAQEQPEGTGSLEEPLAYYLDAIHKRSIFRNPSLEKQNAPVAAVKATLPPVVPPPPPQPTLAELASDLTLVGVITSGEPQAIISSKRTQKTYYVTVGQMIGEMMISKISENRVQLTYNGQTMELSL